MNIFIMVSHNVNIKDLERLVEANSKQKLPTILKCLKHIKYTYTFGAPFKSLVLPDTDPRPFQF